jgi:hypothetical protein
MFFRTTLIVIGTLLMLGMLLTGCGSDEQAANPGIVHEIADSISTTVAKNLNEATLAKTTPLEAESAGSVKLISEIADLQLVGSRLFGVFDGGVVVYDFDNKTYTVIPAGEKLRAAAYHEEKVYVGGDNLYTVNDTILEPVDGSFEGAITSLFSYGYRLMVGTEAGLYSTGIFGHELLFDGITVSAMAADESGLWVGSLGEGLYRWDGEDFRQRYLRRDTSLFDSVNTLAFNHRHLYVGTGNGLHIFDGGRWQTLTTDDGLLSNNVRTIDASGWVVYFGTDAGVISYFNGDFIPVDKLEETVATALVVDGRKVVAATDFDGIVMKSGGVLRTLVPADNGMNFDVVSLIP